MFFCIIYCQTPHFFLPPFLMRITCVQQSFEVSKDRIAHQGSIKHQQSQGHRTVPFALQQQIDDELNRLVEEYSTIRSCFGSRHFSKDDGCHSPGYPCDRSYR